MLIVIAISVLLIVFAIDLLRPKIIIKQIDFKSKAVVYKVAVNGVSLKGIKTFLPNTSESKNVGKYLLCASAEAGCFVFSITNKRNWKVIKKVVINLNDKTTTKI